MKKRTTILFTVFALIFGLVAWSPTPSTDDIVVGSTSMTSPNGQIVVVGTGSSGKAANALVVGKNHVISDASAMSSRTGSVISGASNTVDATQSLVCGSDNSVVSAGSSEVRNSCAVGAGNQILSPRAYVIGYYNMVSGDLSSALGSWLEVDEPSVVAVGQYNADTVPGDVFVVGGGSSDNSRRTALKATSDGSVVLGCATSGKVVLARAQGDIAMGNYSN
jgi:hypothetical protein